MSVIFFFITSQIALVFKQNFGAMVLSLACVAMGLHADYIRNTFDGCLCLCLWENQAEGKRIA